MFFILVEPAVPGNIGAAARAIKTMGFSMLRLVNPCDHLSVESRMLAHASHDVLEQACIYPNLQEALSGIDLSIATTAKTRDARVTYHRNTELPELIRTKGESILNIGLVFGREESGLTNLEIQICDLASTIPLKQDYPSLNLSQAVMLYAYTMAELPAEAKMGAGGTRESEYRVMMDKAGKLLRNLEVDASPALYNRILERLALLGEDDIHLLLSILGRIN